MTKVYSFFATMCVLLLTSCQETIVTGDFSDLKAFSVNLHGINNQKSRELGHSVVYGIEYSDVDIATAATTIKAETMDEENVFCCEVRGLKPNTEYFYRAFSTYKEKTIYGKVKAFKTPEPEMIVDMGLSVKWCGWNIGASKPEEYGDYFSWGETSPKDNYTWETYELVNMPGYKLTKYNDTRSSGVVDNKTVLEPEDDVASVKLGGKWRMPTDAEWTELRAKCTWTWINYSNGVNGYIVTASNGNSIFLPAAGNRYDTKLNKAGSDGYYWSSSLCTEYNPWYVYFDSGSVDKNYYGRCCGLSVRPVSE